VQEPATIRAHCAECGGIRNCHVRGNFAERGGDEVVDWVTEWFLLQCCGCEYVFVQTVSSNSEDYEYEPDESGEPVQVYQETVNHWPAISARSKPEWMTGAGISAAGVDDLNASMLELYGALDAGLPTLAAIGMRSVFDVASRLLGVEPEAPFSRKLDDLVERGHIDRVNRERLEGLVEAGNASAHRGWRPSADDLAVLMEVLEHFIEVAFVVPARQAQLDAKVTRLREGVPARARPARAERPAVGDPDSTGRITGPGSCDPKEADHEIRSPGAPISEKKQAGLPR
jgi:hypothetical protein